MKKRPGPFEWIRAASREGKRLLPLRRRAVRRCRPSRVRGTERGTGAGTNRRDATHGATLGRAGGQVEQRARPPLARAPRHGYSLPRSRPHRPSPAPLWPAIRRSTSPPAPTCRRSITRSIRRMKEIAQRYDFKGTHCTIDFDRSKAEIRLAADDEFRMEALTDVLQDANDQARRAGQEPRYRRARAPPPANRCGAPCSSPRAFPPDAAKKIVKAVKEGGFKKVQASIQGDEVRVTSALPGRAAGGYRGAPGPGLRGRAQVWQLPRLSAARGAVAGLLALTGGEARPGCAAGARRLRSTHAPAGARARAGVSGTDGGIRRPRAPHRHSGRRRIEPPSGATPPYR